MPILLSISGGLFMRCIITIAIVFFFLIVLIAQETEKADPLLVRVKKLEQEIAALKQEIANLKKYEGFSYFTTEYLKQEEWQYVIVSQSQFNTFGPKTYDPFTSEFTAPKDGFYKFSAHGFIRSSTTAVDQRIGIGFCRNEKLEGFSGGQLSKEDSPAPYVEHTMYLQCGDKVRIKSYTVIPVVFGAPGPGHYFFFQGEYLGNR